jgi:hypothetical protein
MAEVIFIPSAAQSFISPPERGFVLEPILTGETVDLPGPAAGFIRIYDTNIGITPDTGGGLVPAIPCFIVDANAVAWQLVGSTPGTASTTLIQALSPIGPGEFYRVGPSPGGAAPMLITASFVDLPASNVGLIRQGITTTPVDIIPAPPPGFFRQMYRRSLYTQLNALGVTLVNRDSSSKAFLWTLGADLIARNATLASGSQTQPVQPTQLLAVTAATGALRLATTTVPATTNPSFLGAYETFPIV